MADLSYFKEHISDELADAVHYAEKALALRNDKSEWAKKFMEMSGNEIKHATMLFNMMETSCDTMPSARDESSTSLSSSSMTKESVCKSVSDEFATAMTKIRNIKDIFYDRI